jgi:hypothetical protein
VGDFFVELSREGKFSKKRWHTLQVSRLPLERWQPLTPSYSHMWCFWSLGRCGSPIATLVSHILTKWCALPPLEVHSVFYINKHSLHSLANGSLSIACSCLVRSL